MQPEISCEDVLTRHRSCDLPMRCFYDILGLRHCSSHQLFQQIRECLLVAPLIINIIFLPRLVTRRLQLGHVKLWRDDGKGKWVRKQSQHYTRYRYMRLGAQFRTVRILSDLEATKVVLLQMSVSPRIVQPFFGTPCHGFCTLVFIFE